MIPKADVVVDAWLIFFPLLKTEASTQKVDKRFWTLVNLVLISITISVTDLIVLNVFNLFVWIECLPTCHRS